MGRVLLVLVPLLFATGCPASETPTGTEDLVGRTWVVSSLSGHDPLPEGLWVTAAFREGRMVGSGGCNTYGATYILSPGDALSIGEISGTAMGCPGPVGESEGDYLLALGKVVSYRIEGDTLTLFGRPGDVLAEYVADPPPTITDVTLASLAYRDGPMNDKRAMTTPIRDSEITAVFGGDGKLSGSSGCNSYSGDFTIDGDEIQISSLILTGMSCEPELMRQQQGYFEALESARSWVYSGPSFQLLNESKTVAVVFEVVRNPD